MEYYLVIKEMKHWYVYIGELWKPHTKQKKPVTKDHIMYDFIYMKLSE